MSNSRPFPPQLLMVIGLMVLSAVISIFTTKVLLKERNWDRHDEADGHQWLQETLELTPEQATRVNALEPTYREQRAQLQRDFQNRIEQLRQHLVQSESFTDDTRQAIHELHVVHGALQELSIRHYYDMLQVLPADKQEKLRDIASEALSTPQ
ncbi:MAG: periplasmic heavy metal sensor [Puniceicoccaceae bacterium]